MSISEKIRKRVQAKDELELFSFDQVAKQNESHAAISKELSRMCAKGAIKRLMYGIYYKPKISRFGDMKPSENNILKFLLFNNGKQVEYISGDRLYNKLGLTSQVSGVITIASNCEKGPTKFSNLRIRYVKAYDKVEKNNIHLLQLLDALKDIGNIPDSNISNNLTVLYSKLKELSFEDQEALIRIVKKYPPRVKALAGSMMEKIWERKLKPSSELDKLKSSIIDSTKFTYPINYNVLKNPISWNIRESTSRVFKG